MGETGFLSDTLDGAFMQASGRGAGPLLGVRLDDSRFPLILRAIMRGNANAA